MKKIFFSSLVLSSVLYAQTECPKTPEQIQQEILQAQRDFETAQEMFIPWYTGPLITSSAKNVAQGHFNMQGYLYFDINYAQFDKHRKSVKVPNTYVLNPLLVLQAGITQWLDVTVIPQGFFRWKEGHYADSLADLPVQFGFQLVRETPTIPSMRLTVGESFPIGKYQHLNPHKQGIDAGGGGIYSTIVGFDISKIFWWFLKHPISVRLAQSYVVPNTRAYVHGFNAYGGGFHTNGSVKVGNTYNADLGVEVSITQRWVFATDIAYTCSNKSTFSGKKGVLASGAEASNGTPSSDQLSFAPEIEYNVSKTGGFIGGVWMTVTGRNNVNFVSFVLSYTQYF